MIELRQQGRFVKGQRYSPATQIQRGEHRSVATEIKRGLRLSPSTEFKRGQPAHNRLPIGAARIRIETHTQLPRAWIKTAEPNTWRKRAVIVWESIHGPLPLGRVVHHCDRNSLNDDPDNLVGLTRKQHAAEHREELAAWRK